MLFSAKLEFFSILLIIHNCTIIAFWTMKCIFWCLVDAYTCKRDLQCVQIRLCTFWTTYGTSEVDTNGTKCNIHMFFNLLKKRWSVQNGRNFHYNCLCMSYLGVITFDIIKRLPVNRSDLTAHIANAENTSLLSNFIFFWAIKKLTKSMFSRKQITFVTIFLEITSKNEFYAEFKV